MDAKDGCTPEDAYSISSSCELNIVGKDELPHLVWDVQRHEKTSFLHML